ncbi:MAG: ATP-binding protein [Acidobacteriota bacterium]
MQQVTLTLPMIPNMELTASTTAGALGEHIGMAQDKVEEVQMAVVEACINAFEHSRSKVREVQVQLLVLGADEDPEGLEITVADDGIGFDPADVAERKDGTELAKLKRGHGLKIIRSLMDEVTIRSSATGTRVTMRKLR